VSDSNEVMYSLDVNRKTCIRCGLCEAFCPVNVFEMHADPDGGKDMPQAVRQEDCWGCETCVGQCPKHAITITGSADAVEADANREVAQPLDDSTKVQYVQWAKTMKEVLGLRWHPVGIHLVKVGEPRPDVDLPTERMRYCQSLMAARRGKKILMPANRHACPDGTSILGLTPMPEKLASGELYILFHKLDNVEAAKRMVHERPCLEPRTVDSTCVFPLDDAPCEAEVVAVIAKPEQMMWLSMATSYYTGHRHDFHASGYNAQCVETTLIPMTSKEINISFGCYGCRASSDVDDSMMMMGIPIELMPDVIKGLEELGKKAIPQSRDKIYL
jgi:uncharacterized protein (DUF169 family)/NAD-dependent dihydropyrimidine dehydrogenase PreA subunit